MSSQDGSNRSRRSQGSSQFQRRQDAQQRRNRTWDVDPAEIDRYLSGRPTQSDEDAARGSQRRGAGGTADQLSRLQNAVGRRPARQPDDEPNQRTTRSQAARRPVEPEPTEYYTDSQYADVDDDQLDVTYAEPVDPYAYEDDVTWDEPAPAPPTTRRARPQTQPSRPASGRQQARPARYAPPPVDVYDDDEYDDELYNDDPYLGYEDDEIDRQPPRTPRPRQRAGSQRQIAKPNLPKVTIPKAVTESPLLADTASIAMIAAAIVSVALMAFLVSDRMNVLGDAIPTHVNASGEWENFRTREAIWNIPLLAGMVMLMNLAASWFIARIDTFATRFLLAAGLLVHFVAWVALVKYLWD